ncbi:MAG: hypothetical protein RIR52_2679 [Acidobacteriota bacterium]
MSEDYTDIIQVVDRSGSMEAERGINNFISEQSKRPGERKVTLVQFDKVKEVVFRGVKGAEYRRYSLIPSWWHGAP